MTCVSAAAAPRAPTACFSDLPRCRAQHSTDGLGGRDVYFSYACGSSAGTVTKFAQPSSLTYTVGISGLAACGKVPPAPPLSGGSALPDLLRRARRALLRRRHAAPLPTLTPPSPRPVSPCQPVRHELPGTYYNVRYRELHGLEAIPQWNHWRELPGLVRAAGRSRGYAPAPAPARARARARARAAADRRAPLPAARSEGWLRLHARREPKSVQKNVGQRRRRAVARRLPQGRRPR